MGNCRKFVFGLVLSLFAVHVLFSGGKQEDDNSLPRKAALLVSGPISDPEKNLQIYRGVLKIEKTLDIPVVFSDMVYPEEAEELLAGYAMSGYQLIFVHGEEFTGAVLRVAAEYPETIFIMTCSAEAAPPNVGSVIADMRQAGFLSGFIAALISRTGVIASVSGEESRTSLDYQTGVSAGAEYTGRETAVLVRFLGNTDDPAAVKKIIHGLVDQGADVIIHQAGNSGVGIIMAAGERGVPVIGVGEDYSEAAPETVVAGILTDNTAAVFTAAQLVLQGRFTPRIYRMGVAEQVIVLMINDDINTFLPQEERRRIPAMLEDLKEGRIKGYR